MSPVEQLEELELVERVERFEAARAEHGTANLEDFVPSPDHPLYLDILSELIRVDLEYHWSRREARPLHWYRERWPAVFDDPELLAGIAYEEYRLRCDAGEDVSTIDYQNEFNVDVALWPLGLRPVEPDEISIPSEARQRLESAAIQLEFQPGDRILGFEIDRELGRGASARVFLAKQESLANRHVVLKVSQHRTAEPDRLARLQHQNIVPLFSCHVEGRTTIMCMPYLGRSTLAAWVTQLKKRPLPPATTADFVTTFTRRPDPTEHGVPAGDPLAPVPARTSEGAVGLELGKCWSRLRPAPYERTVLWLVAELAKGLAHAHDQDVLHLDLKPANILMTDDGRPMLLDFHLATLTGEHSAPVEVAGGTLPYMSPEQLSALVGQGTVDRRSDLYSLGVVLFELLTGQLPFPSRPAKRPASVRDQDTQLKVSRLKSERSVVPSARAVHGLVSYGAESIVRRCLDPDPEKRYASAEELLEDLELHLQDRPLKHAPNTSLPELARKWGRRHNRLTSLGVAGCVATLLGSVAVGGAHYMTRRLPALEAQRVLHEVERQATDVKTSLFLAGRPHDRFTADHFVSVQSEAVQLLRHYGADRSDGWREHPLVRFLPEPERQTLERDVGQLLYLLAAGELRFGQADLEPREVRQAGLQRALDWNRRAADCVSHPAAQRAILRQQAELLRGLNQESAARAIEQDLPGGTLGALADPFWFAMQVASPPDVESAREFLAEVKHTPPRDVLGWFVAGDCHRVLQQLEEAERCFTVCTALHPDSVFPWQRRAQTRIARTDWEGALSDLAKVLQLDPELPGAWWDRTLALIGLGDGKEALVALHRAEETGFPKTRVHFQRAEILRKLGRRDEAIAEFQHGLQSEPADALGFAVRGQARAPADPHGALLDFEEALRRDPGCVDAGQLAAWVLAEKLENQSAALEVLDRLLEQKTGVSEVWSGRAVVHARLGNSEAAQSDISRALKLPHKPIVDYQAGCAAALQGPECYEQALTLIAQAFRAEPQICQIAKQDGDLVGLREDPRFQDLCEAAQLLSRKMSPN